MTTQAELARLDPFAVAAPLAFERWREKQKMLAQHLEEHTYRDEKVAMQTAFEALSDEESKATDAEKLEALRHAVETYEALHVHASDVFEYWHDKASTALHLLLSQIECKEKLVAAIAAMSKFKLRRELKRAHDAKLNSENCKEAKKAKKVLNRLQKMDKEPLYESDEDVPPMTEDELILYRLTYHEEQLAPAAIEQPRPYKERATAMKVELEAAGIEPKLPLEEYVFLDDFRQAAGWQGWRDKGGWDDFLAAPEKCFGLTVFYNQFNGMGNVTEIRLPNNKLHGLIPDTIGRLHSLSLVDLARNELGGLIPEAIATCKSIAVLDLSSNAFYGEIPDALSCCWQLNTIIFNHNRLCGAIPQSLCKLSNLNGIGLKWNLFTTEQQQHAVEFLFEHFKRTLFMDIEC